ncbi:MAG: DMT family transporter [Patescibacteria group bacterium]
MNKNNTLTLTLLFLSAVLYSSYFVSTKYMLLQGIHPLAIASSVATVLTVYITVIMFFDRNFAKEVHRLDWYKISPLLIAGIAVSGIGPILLFYGQTMTSVTNSAFIFQLSPLFAGLLGIIFLKERPRLYFWLSLIIILAGLFFLTTKGGVSSPTLGDLMVLILAFLFGAYNTIAQTFSVKMSPLTLSNIRMLVGNILVILSAWFILGSGSVLALFQFPLLIIFSALFIYLYVFATHVGIKQIGSSNTTALLTVTALFSTLFASLIGEIPMPIQFIGGLIVILGIVLLVKRGMKTVTIQS